MIPLYPPVATGNYQIRSFFPKFCNPIPDIIGMFFISGQLACGDNSDFDTILRGIGIHMIIESEDNPCFI